MHGRVCWSVLSRLWGQQIWDKFSKFIMGSCTNCQSSYHLFLNSKMRANQFKIATSLDIRPSKQVENQLYQGRNGLFSITEELLTGRQPRSKTRNMFPTKNISDTISSMVWKCFEPFENTEQFWLASLFLSPKERREIHHFAWLEKVQKTQVCGRVSCWCAEIQSVSEVVLYVLMSPSRRKSCWGCQFHPQREDTNSIFSPWLKYKEAGKDRCAC